MAKILVCEDDKLLGRIIDQVLTSKNHEVKLVADGNLAIEELKSNYFDLIITDINMPGKSGIQLTYFTRKVIHSQTPILLISGISDANQIRQAKKKGANDFLPKPFAIEKLKRKATQLLQHNQRINSIPA